MLKRVAHGIAHGQRLGSRIGSLAPVWKGSLGWRNFAVKIVESEDELRRLKLESKKLLVIDWSATWCGPCKQIAPQYEMLSNQHDAVFVKVDIDSLNDAAVDAGIESVPTFQLYYNTKLVGQSSGADILKLTKLIQNAKQSL